jgi:TRAP-type C4-dicarboxylate transport system substrate-binding protein
MSPRAILTALLAALACTAPVLHAERIRLGTLAPRGTSFHQILLEMGEEWSRLPGNVQLTIFPDGTMGTEQAMVGRMRLGQLQAALISITGLSQIEPGTSVLQNLPFTFRSLDEAIHVREQLGPELERRLEERGFIVLGWTDGGWIQFFSRQPVVTPQDVRQRRLFAWAGDRSTIQVARDLGFQPVPLEPTDILVSLNTGMVDVVPAPPFFALASQMFTPAPHMLEVNYAPIVGAIVVTKRTWNRLPPEAREGLRTSGARAAQRITERSRVEMGESIAAMQNRGLSVTVPDESVRAQWIALGDEARPRLRGTVVDTELFDRAISALESYRSKRESSN